jgi:Uma2 family endonuclease
MSTPAQRKMTVDEFLVWAEGQEGRWELYRGVPYLMAPERARHGEVKFAVQTALLQGIRKASLTCHMRPDGATVRISQHVAHEPDALVYCGPKLPDDSVEVPEPVIVVEVASPSTRKIDGSLKLMGYFTLPSVHHYLIVDPDGPPLVHHRRQGDGTILTTIVPDGVLRLDPPGIEVAVAEIFAGVCVVGALRDVMIELGPTIRASACLLRHLRPNQRAAA